MKQCINHARQNFPWLRGEGTLALALHTGVNSETFAMRVLFRDKTMMFFILHFDKSVHLENLAEEFLLFFNWDGQY